ncbi:YdcF family protein [Amycolatopsis granulosa]|uniref:YdcF family protein n=1 Tax=Amycolatopsis granulosa TaxID=185684 RepID=UPI00141FEC70|nr:YdcF family protein [Amycolatopsis granulosa]NIH88263.1 uncharacterized SAM-binding protein YcdF (DUF218 family) [Amycolatopsis granulosa]
MTAHATLPGDVLEDAEILWRFHRLDDELRPVDVAIGLGSHDGTVPVYAAELYHRGLFPWLVFTGANAPTTVERFPRGEAIHYREIALEHGVPESAILVEPKARHTGENIDLTRELLAAHGIQVQSALIVCRPYQQRRAYATAKRRWPEINILCSAIPQGLGEYLQTIGDPNRVVNMLVGDTQRLTIYADTGDAIPQEIPPEVAHAYERLVSKGYTQRLIR